jgi:hypothetical protein
MDDRLVVAAVRLSFTSEINDMAYQMSEFAPERQCGDLTDRVILVGN